MIFIKLLLGIFFIWFGKNVTVPLMIRFRLFLMSKMPIYKDYFDDDDDDNY